MAINVTDPPATEGTGIGTISSTLQTTALPVDGGVDAVAGSGKTYLLTVGGVWVTGDLGQVILTDNLGISYVLGDGNVTAVQPVFCMTLREKVYVIGGTSLFFCEVQNPDSWNNLEGIGNGFINVSFGFSLPENLVAVAPYQGKLAVISSDATQIYSIATNPADYAQQQVLPNIGSIAAESVKSLGNLDVLMLAYNGVRSLRVRDSSLNAMTVDIGSPIDSLIAAKLAEASEDERAAACAIVDPDSGRYWLFLKDTIYVLSYFESAQVAAWSTYLPETLVRATKNPTSESDNGTTITGSYIGLVTGRVYSFELTGGSGEVRISNGGPVQIFNGTSGFFTATGPLAVIVRPTGTTMTITSSAATSFAPYRFEVYKGRVYLRANGFIFLYGGEDNTEYDDSVATWETPWLNNKQSATRKLARALDATYQGTWQVKCGLDFISENMQLVTQTDDSKLGTQEDGSYAFSAMGTHFKFRGQTVDNDASKFSAFTLHFKNADAR